MHRWDEGSFPFRYQEAFCSYQQESQNQDGMDEESFQELAADYQRLMGRETKKKRKKEKKRKRKEEEEEEAGMLMKLR